MKCFLERRRKNFLQLFKLLHELSKKSPSPYLPDFIEQETTAFQLLSFFLFTHGKCFCLPVHQSRSRTSVYVGKEAISKSACCQSYKIAGIIFIYPFVFGMEILIRIYFSFVLKSCTATQLMAHCVTCTYFTSSDSESHSSSHLSLSHSRCSQSSWTQSLLWK